MRQKSFKPRSSNLTSSAKEKGIFFFLLSLFCLPSLFHGENRMYWRQQAGRKRVAKALMIWYMIVTLLCVRVCRRGPSTLLALSQSFTDKQVPRSFNICLLVILSFFRRLCHMLNNSRVASCRFNSWEAVSSFTHANLSHLQGRKRIAEGGVAFISPPNGKESSILLSAELTCFSMK